MLKDYFCFLTMFLLEMISSSPIFQMPNQNLNVPLFPIAFQYVSQTLQEIYICMCACVCVKSLQSCQTLCQPMDCSLPGSNVIGILKARILEWVVILFSRGSSCPRDQTLIALFPDLVVNFFPTSTTWQTRVCVCVCVCVCVREREREREREIHIYKELCISIYIPLLLFTMPLI